MLMFDNATMWTKDKKSAIQLIKRICTSKNCNNLWKWKEISFLKSNSASIVGWSKNTSCNLNNHENLRKPKTPRTSPSTSREKLLLSNRTLCHDSDNAKRELVHCSGNTASNDKLHFKLRSPWKIALCRYTKVIVLNYFRGNSNAYSVSYRNVHIRLSMPLQQPW